MTELNSTYCCIPGCDSDTFKRMDSSITLHKFPKETKLSVRWIQQINSAYKKPGEDTVKWFPKVNAVVCSKHFQATDFANDMLKPKAVPSIFINRTNQPANPTQPPVQQKIVKTPSAVKPEQIKDILSRASALFNKNMAIAKSLEGTAPGPEVSLDVSLADLKAKLQSPVNKENDVQKDSQSMPTTSNIMSITQTTKSSPQVGDKRKLEDDSKWEFIKIGENKFLKIQRQPSSGKVPSPAVAASPDLTNKTETLEKKTDEVSSVINMLAGDCSAEEKKNVIDAMNKFNIQSMSLNSKSNLSSSVAVSKITAPVLPKGDSQTEFIKIGEGKYLKVACLPANKPVNSSAPMKKGPQTKKTTNSLSKGGKKPSEGTNKSTAFNSSNVHSHSIEHLLQEDDVAMDPQNEEPCSSSNAENTSVSTEKNEISIASVASIQQVKLLVSTNKPDLSKANKSPKKTLNPATSKPKKKPSVKKDQIPLKQLTSKLNKRSLKQVLSHISPVPMYKLSLEEENNLLKKKVEELKKKIAPINQLTVLESENIALKKEVEQLKKLQKGKEDVIHKRIKTIQEESAKGDPAATYILDLINGFNIKLAKYSDSTYMHCALLCRKNAQAYELFRKAELFKLPTFNTVDRYIRRNPGLSLSGKTNPGDTKHGLVKINSNSPNKTPQLSFSSSPTKSPPKRSNGIPILTNSPRSQSRMQSHRTSSDSAAQIQQQTLEVDINSTELREVVLETGEVVQCYSSDICIGEDGHQYFIMRDAPNTNAAAHHSQDKYIPNSSGQFQYTETEVQIATEMIS